jgi:small conductance mechanosensitive channel
MEPPMDPRIETLSRTQQALAAFAVQFAPKLLSAALILLVGYFVTRWAGRLAARGLGKLDLDPPVRQLLERIARVLVFGLFLLMALQNLGVELLPLIAGLGIAGAGIALAMQGVLGNVAAGLTIIFTRPFRVGEYISIAGEEGEVRHISIFSTILRHADLSDVVIPNRKIAGEILHNYGSLRQLVLAIAVPYDADLGRAVQIAQAVLAANPRVLRDPAPLILVAALDPYSIGIAVKPWVAVPDYGPAIGEINQALVQACRGSGIALPLPRQEVRVLPAATA